MGARAGKPRGRSLRRRGHPQHEVAFERDLDALDGVHRHEAQVAIEDVLLPRDREASAWLEALVGSLAMKPVPAQAVVAHHREAIANLVELALHPSAEEELRLIFECQGGFGEDHDDTAPVLRAPK